MVKIRKVSCLDKFRLRKMISFLSDDAIAHYTRVLKNFPYMTVHDLLPLKLKFLPESFVLEDEKEILGMITVTRTHGNPFKLSISRLYLEKDYYNIGKQLIDFVIARYGAKGANSFRAIIDDSNEELLQLFVDGCGFRQCSSEQLWKVENLKVEKTSKSFFRPFKNSDAAAVSEMFNESLISHFKYSVSRTKTEYYENVLKGLSEETAFKYVAETGKKAINAYFSIITTDNNNFILTITSSPWIECSYDDILNFAVREVTKRNKKFCLFIRIRKYTNMAESLENYLKDKGAKCVQNQAVLVKDFYRVIKEAEPAHRIVLFNEINEKPVFKTKYE